MAIPSLILTPHESRSRYGTVTPETAGIVDATEHGWKLWRGLEGTSMLATQGRVLVHGDPVEPEVVGAGPIMVDSPYGPAWAVTEQNGYRVHGAGLVQRTEGTFLVRVRFRPNGTTSQFPLSLATESGALRLQYGRRGSDRWHLMSGGNGRGVSVIIEDDEWYAMGLRVEGPSGDGWTYRMYTTDGSDTGGTFPSGYDLSEVARVTIGGHLNAAEMDIAGVAMWDHDIGDAEARRAMHDLPSWGPTGTITVPHPAPIGDLLIRYREGGALKSHRLRGPGRFGQHGIARWEDGQLTITTERELELLGLIAYPAEASVSAFGMTSRGGAPELTDTNVDTSDAITLYKGLGNPVVLLSPDGTHDRTGPADNDLYISNNIGVTEGQYGSAWYATTGGNDFVRYEMPTTDAPARTVIVRGRFSSDHPTLSYLMEVGSWNVEGQDAVFIRRYSDRFNVSVRHSNLTEHHTNHPLREDEWFGAYWWRDGDQMASGYTDGSSGGDPRTFESTGQMRQYVRALGGGPSPGVYFEGGLVYDEALPLDEIQRIGELPRRWEWGPDGTITIPLTAAPRRIIIRTRDDNGDVWTHDLDATDDYFGDHGWLAHEGEQLRIGTDHTTTILSVVIDPELSDEEALKVLQSDVWRWNTVLPLPAGIVSGEVDVGINVIPRDVDVPIAVIPGEVRHG